MLFRWQILRFKTIPTHYQHIIRILTAPGTKKDRLTFFLRKICLIFMNYFSDGNFSALVESRKSRKSCKSCKVVYSSELLSSISKVGLFAESRFLMSSTL